VPHREVATVHIDPREIGIVVALEFERDGGEGSMNSIAPMSKRLRPARLRARSTPQTGVSCRTWSSPFQPSGDAAMGSSRLPPRRG